MPTPDPIAGLELDIRADLDRVEDALRAACSSEHTLVDEAGKHLLAAGGKRFRPMLVLLAGHLGDPANERLVPCAAAIELTHLATLYHDDVIDEAAVRRGTPSANVRYDNTVAVLTGDFLFARSSGIAADLGTYVSRTLADTIAALCEGQIMESDLRGDLEQGPEGYLEVIRRKTAVLIATSCHLGAWLAGASPEAVEAATVYGEALGMAFQLSDDVLDIAGDPSDSGKVPGTDIRERIYTLPVLATLSGEVPGGGDLRAALAAADTDAALEILRGNGALDVAGRAVDGWRARAVEALEAVPAGPAREALDQLAAFVVTRRG